MGYLRSLNIDTRVDDPKTDGDFTSAPLEICGMNFLVDITPNVDTPPSPKTILAHLDTGASVSSIDINLAKHMNLTPFSYAHVRTANGVARFPQFFVNLRFPMSTLSPQTNLLISSGNLGFDIGKDPHSHDNFGLLIGRDVMASWSIFWNGPTSTVIIND